MQINSNYYGYRNYSPNFGGRIEKVKAALRSTLNVKVLKVTTDEAIKIYEELGYAVKKKAGSHITITHPNGLEFALKIPHGGEKRFIHGDSVRTLQCAVFEDFGKLVQSLHYHRA